MTYRPFTNQKFWQCLSNRVTPIIFEDKSQISLYWSCWLTVFCSIYLNFRTISIHCFVIEQPEMFEENICKISLELMTVFAIFFTLCKVIHLGQTGPFGRLVRKHFGNCECTVIADGRYNQLKQYISRCVLY